MDVYFKDSVDKSQSIQSNLLYLTINSKLFNFFFLFDFTHQIFYTTIICNRHSTCKPTFRNIPRKSVPSSGQITLVVLEVGGSRLIQQLCNGRVVRYDEYAMHIVGFRLNKSLNKFSI